MCWVLYHSLEAFYRMPGEGGEPWGNGVRERAANALLWLWCEVASYLCSAYRINVIQFHPKTPASLRSCILVHSSRVHVTQER